MIYLSQIKYQITLSLDGNHAVSVSGDDKEALKEGLTFAKEAYDKLKAKAGSKQVSAPQPLQAPLCPIHHSPMSWVDRNGGFFSCHKKNPDGSWCSYRPRGMNQQVDLALPS